MVNQEFSPQIIPSTPLELWKASMVTDDLSKTEVKAQLTPESHSCVLSYFYIEQDIVSGLSGEDIVALRETEQLRRYLRELNTLIEVIITDYFSGREESGRANYRVLEQLLVQIKDVIAKKINQERHILRAEANIQHAADVGSDFIPYSGIGRKVVGGLSKLLAKKVSFFRWLEWSNTPINALVTEIHSRALDRRLND
jgi:hypothetical protein